MPAVLHRTVLAARRSLRGATSACCSSASSRAWSSEREIAWRCADSLSLHRFLKLTQGETAPDHSTLSVTRSRLPLEIHHAVFGFILEIADRHDLVKGQADRRRRLDPAGQCRAAPPGAAGHRRGLPGDAAASGSGERHRDAECRGSDPLRPRPQGQDPVERRLGVADRSRGPHRPDEGRHHAPRLQAGARRRSRHRRDRGGPDPSGRPGRHPDPRRYAGTGRSHARSGRLARPRRRPRPR